MPLKRRVPPVVLPDISETPEEEKIFSGEPIGGMGSEAPPTPEEQKRETDELAKSKAGAVIYTVAFIVNIILCLKIFVPCLLLRMSTVTFAHCSQ